jgi:hypothetical protein
MTNSILKRNPLVVMFALLILASAVTAQTDAEKAFATIKTLPGTWEGKGPDGHPLQVTCKITSGGSAVMSEIFVPNEDMISVIHLDGPKRLLLTHYCAAGNQPRMQASVSTGGKDDHLQLRRCDESRYP